MSQDRKGLVVIQGGKGKTYAPDNIKHIIDEVFNKLVPSINRPGINDAVPQFDLLRQLRVLYDQCMVECGLMTIGKSGIEVMPEFFDRYTRGQRCYQKGTIRGCTVDGVSIITVIREDK